jgi:hypothetical protein
MKEAPASETSVLTRAAWRNIPEDTILYSHRCENLKSYENFLVSIWGSIYTIIIFKPTTSMAEISNTLSFARLLTGGSSLVYREYETNIQIPPYLFEILQKLASVQRSIGWQALMTKNSRTHLNPSLCFPNSEYYDVECPECSFLGPSLLR